MASAIGSKYIARGLTASGSPMIASLRLNRQTVDDFRYVPVSEFFMRYLFKKSQRVVRGADFTFMLRRGECVADGVLVMFVVRGEAESAPKIGITIPKKTGNAVRRNLWKRLIRESFRTQQHVLPRGIKLIVRPKKGASPDWKQIRASVPKLAAKAVKRMA